MLTSPLFNPSQPGTFSFEKVVYAAPGLNYQKNPDLNQYLGYQTPSSGYKTRRINLEGIAELGFGIDWPFDITQIPINGLLRVPKGNGFFPLVLFAHGNHEPLEHSTPGYLYLCELLASHGIIAGTIDVNFLNGGNFGENDGRAIVHLEHVHQFQLWNRQPLHPLRGKVDLTRVIIVGHSRGGEAVGHASLFKTLKSVQFDPMTPPVPLDGSHGLGPYNFTLRAAVAIAPTDGQYTPVTGATQVQHNYLILHGSRDGDVSSFEGYKTYDRSHTVNLGRPAEPASGFKSLLWIHGANHNFFNSVWQQESQNTITREQQEQIAKVYISAIAQALLLDKSTYLQLLENHAFGEQASWLPPQIKLVSQYQDAKRLFVQHFEEAPEAIVVSKPALGTVDTTHIKAKKQSFNGTDPSQNLFQETQGLRLEWQQKDQSYRVSLDPTSLNLASFNVLAFRVGQSIEPQNPENQRQDFMIEVRDSAQSIALSASSINQMIYPDKAPSFSGGQVVARTVMQTFRIPLKLLAAKGLNVQKLSEIKLVFGVVPTGVLYLDELQLSH